MHAAKATIGEGSGRRPSLTAAPIMLALSTFRQSDRAIEVAIDKAAPCKRLIVVYVVDVNLGRYMIGSDLGFVPSVQEQYKKELLREHRERGEGVVQSISRLAAPQGIMVDSHIVTGRFALEILDVAETERPSVIITTRSRRPKWIKKLFGSPVDYLSTHARCEVMEA